MCVKYFIVDLFLSLSEHTNGTLKEVYNKLFDCLTSAGYAPRRQNVSLNITVAAGGAGAEAPSVWDMDGMAESRALIQGSRNASSSMCGEGPKKIPRRAEELSQQAQERRSSGALSALLWITKIEAGDGTAESRALTQGLGSASSSTCGEGPKQDAKHGHRARAGELTGVYPARCHPCLADSPVAMRCTN
jgi:hypothetical protein